MPEQQIVQLVTTARCWVREVWEIKVPEGPIDPDTLMDILNSASSDAECVSEETFDEEDRDIIGYYDPEGEWHDA